jgi:hypothetical protein
VGESAEPHQDREASCKVITRWTKSAVNDDLSGIIDLSESSIWQSGCFRVARIRALTLALQERLPRFRTHSVAEANYALAQYQGPAGLRDGSGRSSRRLGEAIQVLAWLTETRATQERGAHPEFTVDQMIERDAGSRDVAAGLRSGDLDPEPFPLSVEHAAQKAPRRPQSR